MYEEKIYEENLNEKYEILKVIVDKIEKDINK